MTAKMVRGKIGLVKIYTTSQKINTITQRGAGGIIMVLFVKKTLRGISSRCLGLFFIKYI